MGKRTSKIIETGQGEGKIFENSIFIDTVHYNYQISQEFILIEAQEGSDSMPGLKELSGDLKLRNKRLDILGKYLELELSDKSVRNIVIRSGDFIEGEYRFISGPSN
ncbi:MAG: hypothetical protein WA116_11040 [Anaerolineaceae bacterium]